MKKRAFLGDLFSYILVLFALAIVIVIVGYTWTTINTAWQSNAAIPIESKNIISTQTNRFGPVWDGFMVLAIIGYAIAIIILATSIRSHPMFAMLGFIIMVVLGIVGVHLANAYNGFATSGDIASTANTFTLTALLMDKLPYVVVAIGVLFIVVLYAKNQSQSII